MFDAHSPEAQAISNLFVQTLVVCALIGALVTGLVAYCLVRFRQGQGPDEPVQVEGHTKLEIAWTVGPLITVIGLLAVTARAMGASDPPAPDRAPDIVVTGHQWWWEARYANGAVAANEIHIPVGKDLFVRVES
ncbi:MAG: cytochrome c oxidase subunit II transmembrane domain-containing protein, partial [Polyangiaceae bacterium]